jgi:hypothetical protein
MINGAGRETVGTNIGYTTFSRREQHLNEDWVFFHLKYEAFYDIRHVYAGSAWPHTTSNK